MLNQFTFTGFKYSRRMICTSVLVGLALYEVSLAIMKLRQKYTVRPGGGELSHFGGAAYVGLLRPAFSAPLSSNDQIF